jgi:hypothetical protein
MQHPFVTQGINFRGYFVNCLGTGNVADIDSTRAIISLPY